MKANQIGASAFGFKLSCGLSPMFIGWREPIYGKPFLRAAFERCKLPCEDGLNLPSSKSHVNRHTTNNFEKLGGNLLMREKISRAFAIKLAWLSNDKSERE